MNKFEKVNELIKGAKTAALVGHIRPDGDCIGCCIAMRLALLDMGYTAADVYIDGSISSTFAYMSECKNITTKPITEDFDKKYELLIVLDCADEKRLGVYTDLRKYCDKVICIDHHQNTSIEADVMITDPKRSSAGSMLYEYFTEYSVEITKDMATALYTSVASDTGCFLFSNTTSYAHRVAADLMERGIDFEKINYYNFRVYEASNIETLIYVLRNIKMHANKQIAVIYLSYGAIKKMKIDNDFRHKFQKYAEDISGVRASVCLSERERGIYHISLRSHGDTNVSQVAEHFGGGGHRNAAGITMKGNIKQVIKEIVDKLESALK